MGELLADVSFELAASKVRAQIEQLPGPDEVLELVTAARRLTAGCRCPLAPVPANSAGRSRSSVRRAGAGHFGPPSWRPYGSLTPGARPPPARPAAA